MQYEYAARVAAPPKAVVDRTSAFATITIFLKVIARMKVFFYGLFMDKGLLARKGITPSEAAVGYVDGFGLLIGERATLLRSVDTRAYGIMMEISAAEAEDLYSDGSVADYVPEPVTVQLTDGRQVDASCYNLPAEKITGTNKGYAEALLKVATELGLPESYLGEIRRAGR